MLCLLATSVNTEEKKQKEQKAERREERDEMKDSDRCESRVTGYIPDMLAEVIYQLLIDLKFLKLTCIIDRNIKLFQRKCRCQEEA